MSNLPVKAERIADIIEGLAEITEPDRPYTRRAFTPMFLEGRAFLDRQFKAAGLETRIDTSGNLIGLRKGRKPGLGTIMLGSHSDTVPEGGRFDGIAGVAAALEVARALDDAGIRLDHEKGALEVGKHADIAVLTPEAYVYDAAESGNNVVGWSPYNGIRLPWRVSATWLRGKLAFDGTRVLAEPGTGSFVRPLPTLVSARA